MIRDILKLFEQIEKASRSAAARGVMTDAGTENARDYTAILAGRQATGPRPAQGYANILPPSPAGSRPVIPLASFRSVIPTAQALLPPPPTWRYANIHADGGSEEKLPSPIPDPRSPHEPIDLPEPSVREDVKGLTWAERWDRLKRSGKLLSEAEVAARTLTKRPTRRQIVVESEREEQRLRDQEAAERRTWRAVIPLMPEAPPVVRPAQTAAEEPAQNKLLEALKRLTDALLTSAQPPRTVRDEVAGLSWGERLARLKGSGKLLSEEDVKAALVKTHVSPRDVILESERREQQQRDEARRAGSPRAVLMRLAGQFFGRGGGGDAVAAGAAGEGPGGGLAAARIAAGLAGRAGASGAAGSAAAAPGLGATVARLAGLANPVTALASAVVVATVTMLKLPGAVQRLAGSLIEAQRPLAKYNASLAAMFTRLDYQTRLLDFRTAQATSGSSRALGQALEDLRNETQWAREAMASFKNVSGVAATQFARLVNLWIETMTIWPRLAKGLEALEKLLGKQRDFTTPYIRHLQTIASGSELQPKNKKPGRTREESD